MSYARTHKLKIRVDRKRGTESADSLTRKGWGRTHPEFRVIDKLKELGTMRNNFAKDALTREPRMFFNLLVHGTSEGRFSSSGKRKGIDLNIQNQPKEFRKIYVPEPGNCLIELDYSGGENWLTAWLAQDKPRLERLSQPGYSEHLHLAQLIFGFGPEVTKKEAQNWHGQDVYDIAKHINHGGNYGMTHVKQKEYCDGEGYFFSEAEHKEFIRTRESMNPGTTLWQKATIEAALRDGALRNPFGRMRWFSTRDVATKALAFLPASTLADIIIRAMIGHYPERFGAELQALGLQITGSIEPNWFMQIQIHDSLVLQGPPAGRDTQYARTKSIMTQPWAELQGFALQVEGKVGEPNQDWASLRTVKG
jgi:DNA polymerase I-like protein with 3'-5' exonuclease and polymerase domains